MPEKTLNGTAGAAAGESAAWPIRSFGRSQFWCQSEVFLPQNCEHILSGNDNRKSQKFRIKSFEIINTHRVTSKINSDLNKATLPLLQ